MSTRKSSVRYASCTPAVLKRNRSRRMPSALWLHLRQSEPHCADNMLLRWDCRMLKIKIVWHEPTKLETGFVNCWLNAQCAMSSIDWWLCSDCAANASFRLKLLNTTHRQSINCVEFNARLWVLLEVLHDLNWMQASFVWCSIRSPVQVLAVC